MVKILDSSYVKADLHQIADNANQMNYEERTLLLSFIEDFEDLFDGNLGEWDTEPVDLNLNPDSKPLNSEYYSFPRINKETYQNKLKRLVKIILLTSVQKSQYGAPIFIIPKKEETVRFITDYHRLNQKLARSRIHCLK